MLSGSGARPLTRLPGRFAKLAELMDEAEHDVLAFMAFPKEHWSQIASTHPLERVNKEIKRRSRRRHELAGEACMVWTVWLISAACRLHDFALLRS